MDLEAALGLYGEPGLIEMTAWLPASQGSITRRLNERSVFGLFDLSLRMRCRLRRSS